MMNNTIHTNSILHSLFLLFATFIIINISINNIPTNHAFTFNNNNHNIIPLIQSPLYKSRLFDSSSSSSSSSLSSSENSGYVPPEQSSNLQKRNKPPQPKVGDIVRYYDLDGGKSNGQELVGKITYIQSRAATTNNNNDNNNNQEWIADITEMEDVGDGYYTDYPSRKRRKSKVYNLQNLSPLIASYVRSEDAFKIPLDAMGRPKPTWERYDLENYEGPMKVQINQDIVQDDFKNYSQLKIKLLKDAAIAGLIGTVVTDLVKGIDDALIYFAGAVAGIGYLFFLSVKTDTLGSPDMKMGNNISNLRFLLPLIVLVGVAIQNLIAGDASPVVANGNTLNVFRTVSPEQFGAAMLGFLTYRVPLFLSQLTPLVSDSAGLLLPGSAGMAMQLAKEAKSAKQQIGKKRSILDSDLTTILVVSGPQGAGKTELVQRLIEESEGRLVPPKRLDIISEPILYEKLVSKDEILQVDKSGRYALTKDGILSAAMKAKSEEDVGQVVVVDADVNLCKKLVMIGGSRIVGVWIGLDSVDKFESNLKKLLASGEIPIPENETEESVLRAKIREIVKDIEYGVVSGIFEFTILNDDFDESLSQLKSAADYCFE